MNLILCPECSSDEISKTDFGYYCNDCCYDFDESEIENNDDYEKDDSEFANEFYQTRERITLRRLSLDSLFSVFNPQYQFIKMNDTLYKEDGDLEEYTVALCQSYIDNKSFKEASKIEVKNLSNSERDDAFKRITMLFLSSINELSFLPKVTEWAEYIGAPATFIEDLLHDYQPNLLLALPQVDCGDASLLLSSKLEKLTSEVNSSLKLRNRVSFEEVCQNFDYLYDRNLDYANWEITDFLQDKLSAEIKVLKNYEKENQSFNNNGLQKFYDEGNDKGLTVGEVVKNILNHYFNELFEK